MWLSTYPYWTTFICPGLWRPYYTQALQSITILRICSWSTSYTKYCSLMVSATLFAFYFWQKVMARCWDKHSSVVRIKTQKVDFLPSIFLSAPASGISLCLLKFWIDRDEAFAPFSLWWCVLPHKRATVTRPLHFSHKLFPHLEPLKNTMIITWKWQLRQIHI